MANSSHNTMHVKLTLKIEDLDQLKSQIRQAIDALNALKYATKIDTNNVSEPQIDDSADRQIEKSAPDWTTAPPWAQYWAINQDNKAYWHERKPWLATARGCGYWYSAYKYAIDSNYNQFQYTHTEWQTSLKKRLSDSTNNEAPALQSRPKTKGGDDDN